MLVEELFQRGGGGVFVGALDLDGDGVAALDAHTHERHQLDGVDGLIALEDGDGALVAFDLLDQQTGRARVDADRFFERVGELCRCRFLP